MLETKILFFRNVFAKWLGGREKRWRCWWRRQRHRLYAETMPSRCAYGCATTLMDSKSFHLAVAMVNARQPKRFDVWMEYKSTLSPRWRRRRWWWWYGVQTLIYYFTEVIEWASALSASEKEWANLIIWSFDKNFWITQLLQFRLNI